jgi:hypothetical protein
VCGMVLCTCVVRVYLYKYIGFLFMLYCLLRTRVEGGKTFNYFAVISYEATRP